MPSFTHGTTELAQQAGTHYQQSRPQARRLTLQLVSRQRQAVLHTTRLALIDALNPELVRMYGPAYLEYAGASTTLRLPVIYDSGLENNNEELLELHMFAYDPVWTATTPNTQSIATHTDLDPASFIVQRAANGEWSELDGSSARLDGAVRAILVAADGTRYVGGEFSGNVRRWNATSQQWETLTGLNSDVTCLAEDAQGNIYAGGSFTTPGNYVARWDGSAWAAMGTPGVLPNAIAIGNDGTIFIGGFDMSGTGPTVQQWDNTSSWAAVGSGPGSTVYALQIDASGYLLAGGAFAGGVQRWSGLSWQTPGDGLSKSGGGTPTVRALARRPDGIIYAGGDFDTADGTFAAYVASWNGITWLPLGSSVGAEVRALAVRSSDGVLFAGGKFTVAGGLAVPDKMAQWNGYAWFPLDINISPTTPPDPDILALATPEDQTILAGYGSTATATCAAVTSVTNAGSAAAYPILTIQGPGRVYQFVNWTAGEALYFTLELQEGETLTVDLSPQHKTVTSSFRGNMLAAVVPGSTLATWRLLPGDNAVSLFVETDESGASPTATLTWYERHWSMDGADG
jgi:hypothetical protein